MPLKYACVYTYQKVEKIVTKSFKKEMPNVVRPSHHPIFIKIYLYVTLEKEILVKIGGNIFNFE